MSHNDCRITHGMQRCRVCCHHLLSLYCSPPSDEGVTPSSSCLSTDTDRKCAGRTTVVSGAAEADIHAVARVQVADLRMLEVAD